MKVLKNFLRWKMFQLKEEFNVTRVIPLYTPNCGFILCFRSGKFRNYNTEIELKLEEKKHVKARAKQTIARYARVSSLHFSNALLSSLL